MGGNTKAINRETGETLALAQKLDFTKIDRNGFVQDAKNLFHKINEMYQEKFGEPLWIDLNIIENGSVFNGSSTFLFDENITNEEFVKYKPLVGDIDITIPIDKRKNLFELLVELENKEVCQGMKYLGQNKKDQHGYQINALFEYETEFDAPQREWIPFQVDFEGTEYNGMYPSPFTKFAHNSNWTDIKHGLKGVAHKYLLQNIVRGKTARPDIIMLTPKSSLEEGKIRPKKMNGETPREWAFSVDRGLRKKIYQVLNEDGSPVFYDNKPCFKELETSESTYVTALPELFESLFYHKPDENELEKLHSYLGVLDLMKENFSEKEVEGTYLFLIKKNLWNKVAQQLDRDNWKEDLRIKYNMVKEFKNVFPFIKKHNAEIKVMIKEYYHNYGRKE